MRMGRAIWLSAATMTSRVLGLVRDQLFAALVGANVWSDAFVVGFRIPNLLRDLFAEGALSSAFVPTFAEAHARRGRDDAFRLANALVGLVLVVVGTVVAAGILAAPVVVRLLAPGFGPEQAAFATFLTRIMMPFLLLVSLSAVAMGMLNAQSRFTAPALAPALFNVGAIAVGVWLWASGKGPGPPPSAGRSARWWAAPCSSSRSGRASTRWASGSGRTPVAPRSPIRASAASAASWGPPSSGSPPPR
jgi:putative peptidoglycan lipid II flippase